MKVQKFYISSYKSRWNKMVERILFLVFYGWTNDEIFNSYFEHICVITQKTNYSIPHHKNVVKILGFTSNKICMVSQLGHKDATIKETQQWEWNRTCFIKEETHSINNSMCNQSSVVLLVAWVHICVVLSALTKAQIKPNWETTSGRWQIAQDK